MFVFQGEKAKFKHCYLMFFSCKRIIYLMPKCPFGPQILFQEIASRGKNEKCDLDC